jgi:hypothetical protein
MHPKTHAYLSSTSISPIENESSPKNGQGKPYKSTAKKNLNINQGLNKQQKEKSV